MKKLFILLLLSLNTQAKWEDWNDTDKTLFKTYVLANTIDYLQSSQAIKEGKFRESNRFIGKNPHSDKLLGVEIVGTYGIYRLLNKSNAVTRRRSLQAINTIQWGVVIHNDSIGAKISFSW